MTRAWDEFAAAVFDVMAPQHVLLLLFAAATLSAALWYFHPAWVPRRLPRLRLPRLRWDLSRLRWDLSRLRWDLSRLLRRRRRSTPAAATAPDAAAPVPAGPPVAPGGPSAADLLAAQGRYAEAIRERLREVVGELTVAGVVAPQPGWTAAELADVAATARPAVARPLDDATALFSEIWYGRRPASAGHDGRMRELTGEVRAALRQAGAR